MFFKKRSFDITVVILTYYPNKILLSILNKLSLICSNKKYILEILIIDSLVKENLILNEVTNKNYSFRLRIVSIKKEDFNHGETRNLAVKLSKGKFILFLSQDAYPVGYNFLDNLINDLISKKTVAVFGREVPYPNTQKSFKFFEHSYWFHRYKPYFDRKKRVVFNYHRMINSSNPENKIFHYSLSNVFACYKRSFLKKNKFRMIFHGEDVLMGKTIIDSKHSKIYDSRCVVLHFHDGLFGYIRRNICDLFFRIFVLKTGLNIQFTEKIKQKNLLGKNKLSKVEIIFYYLLKVIILICVLSIRIKQKIVVSLIKERNNEYIKKYI